MLNDRVPVFFGIGDRICGTGGVKGAKGANGVYGSNVRTGLY